MKYIVTVQDAVTAFADWMEPTSAELDAIAQETPLIEAEVELLDVQISLLDLPVTALDGRRLRRARRKVLAVRRDLTNQAVAGTEMAA
ncbi:hypothetical protein SAMN04487983_10877 [Streptomyces sp. yr375]|uniref:DUF6284 family protein n=1 Tax=Streptomyces sp. yr375 TaxID=1761906 RepID=UPI0008BB505B|nr:DUF6284 family protein [Streptomyces sp. yr375]SES49645.1 hypothetical protein SAMN04487983_10877 [Streptomyces sp. yr375]